MSKSHIDFSFIPIPRYFTTARWFESENTLRFVMWAFSKCQSIPHREVIGTTPVLLQPFEFVAGRLTSPAECFMTESAFRNQLSAMKKAGLLKKTTNSVTNQFTCYIWVTECFSEMNDQRNNQHYDQRTSNVTTTNKREILREKKNHHHPEPSSSTMILNPSKIDDPRLIDDFSFHEKDHEKDKNLGNLANFAKKNEQIIQHNNNYQTTPYIKNKKCESKQKKEQTPTINISVIVKGQDTTIHMPEDDYKACIEIKGTQDDLIKHIRYILEHPKRMCDITDWPNAIKNWKMENKAIAMRQSNEDIAKQFVKDYETDAYPGSTCKIHHDRDRDIKGIAFITIGPGGSSQEIIYYSDPEFREKCDEEITNRRMKKKSA